MNSQQMSYFTRVTEYRSISRAAISLGINQSALSRQIQILENELGVALFYRNGRGVVLTPHGSRLLIRATRVLEEIALARQEAANARDDVVAHLTVGITPTVGRVLVRPLAEKLTAVFPGIRLRFIEGFSGHLLEWIDAGQLDVAVLYNTWAASRLNAQPLLTEKLCLVASTRLPRMKPQMPTISLAQFKLILPSPKHGLRRLVNLMAVEQKLTLDISIEADAFDSILSLVRGNLGCTILPAAAIQDELTQGHLQASTLVEPEVTRTLVLVTPNNRPIAQGHSQIVRIIRDELKRFGAIAPPEPTQVPASSSGRRATRRAAPSPVNPP